VTDFSQVRLLTQRESAPFLIMCNDIMKEGWEEAFVLKVFFIEK